jgi:hypothetical protein
MKVLASARLAASVPEKKKNLDKEERRITNPEVLK